MVNILSHFIATFTLEKRLAIGKNNEIYVFIEHGIIFFKEFPRTAFVRGIFTNEMNRKKWMIYDRINTSH